MHVLCWNEVNFIADEQNSNLIFRSILFDFTHPFFTWIECVSIRHIIDKQRSYCSSIKRPCNCSEFLLASCIPDLYLYGDPIFKCYVFCSEFSTNGRCVCLSELSFGESLQHLRFSNTRITYAISVSFHYCHQKIYMNSYLARQSWTCACNLCPPFVFALWLDLLFRSKYFNLSLIRF